MIHEVRYMSVKKTNFNLRHFPLSLHKRLKKFAKKEGRTMTWIILKAVEEYLDQHEKKGA
jgi:predicted DNA-binding protein